MVPRPKDPTGQHLVGVGTRITVRRENGPVDVLIMGRYREDVLANAGGYVGRRELVRRQVVNEDMAYRFAAVKELEEKAGVRLISLGFAGGASEGAGPRSSEAGTPRAEPQGIEGDGSGHRSAVAGTPRANDEQHVLSEIQRDAIGKIIGVSQFEEMCALYPLKSASISDE